MSLENAGLALRDLAIGVRYIPQMLVCGEADRKVKSGVRTGRSRIRPSLGLGKKEKVECATAESDW